MMLISNKISAIYTCIGHIPSVDAHSLGLKFDEIRLFRAKKATTSKAAIIDNTMTTTTAAITPTDEAPFASVVRNTR